MTRSADELLSDAKEELAPHEGDNRLVPLIATGRAPRSVFGMIAAEELRIVRSDWRSFLTLAARSPEPTARALFADLAQGESAALGELAKLASATGMDSETINSYQPRAGCQAYPAYLAWLALNAEPADAIVALIANFAAWSRYCAAIASAMRESYGFGDEACGFFDFFATPVPAIEEKAAAAVQAGIEAGRQTGDALLYGRLLQSYEMMFWNTIADAVR